VTLIDRDIVRIEWITVGVVIGALVGAVFARRVQMTAMPQMVAIFNGLGGAASAVVASAELIEHSDTINSVSSVTIMAGTIIGAVTLTGSFIAFGKLQGFVATRPVLIPARNYVNAVLLVGSIVLAGFLVYEPDNLALFAVMGILALALGVLIVIPIGGADMPVVVALLNSYSGIAAAATGFVLNNNMLIIAGSLVGASGIILTQIMTKAMNRSLANVMLGGFGAVASGGGAAGKVEQRPVRSVTAEDVAMVLSYARSVVFVPGYGLAVAQAQHAVRELADVLKGRGVSVKYAVHPVAGRMPGHMNVLLAEANVPYDELKDLDEINSEFDRTDVSIVIGANDVTNPIARTDPSSPIFGMPILNVDASNAVVVLKRSMASGFAGVDNELFYLDKTMMFFGDARASIESLIREVKAL
ncbi:MAG: NAD(P)(+) transhydrogenase (Re/Si-specific) subunit beta, partial [Chloroflexi bacterium]|nr:NAD(P)(+) transhydrogenase (Re/Si-specific) subunit beta [Chloroflexota bacterium]